MRLRGRDPQGSALPWIANVLGVQSVRLRLRLDRHDNRGKGCWQLVDLGGGSERSCRRLRDRIQPASSQSPMSIPAASVQKQDNSEMQSPAMSPTFIPGQRGKIPGRKRGRPPLRSTVSKMDFQNRYSESLSPLKVPKKRGRKPGFKLKSRIVMTPLAISPPSSTPEPDMSSIPQDAATVPHSVTPQVLTVCIYINKQANAGPNLDRKKVQQLPDHFGPDRPSVVLQQAVQACIDCAFQQKAVFSLLTQGYGGEKISATFDGKQHLLSLPVVNSIGYVLRFLKKMCRSLHCENLFSDQPFMQHSAASYHSEKYFEGNAHSTAETSMPEDYLVDPIDPKRYSVDPSDSAFNLMSSPYPPKPSYGYRSCQQFPGGPAPIGPCRQASSPSTFQEGNRSAYSPSPETQETAPPLSKDPSTWTVEDVVWFVKDADPHALGPHVEIFRKHEIDGNALLLLKSDMIMKYLGLKLGPALKLCYHIDKLKQAKF
ncbi:sex comb on midleg-like protein 4 isoform X1 [Polyodon spathula]|uniref:sex comb on midleg-like protein 4 isoform X1 n=1 Tax=Polyodon spathula TaxID=7913 RepID=UPI001B7E846E|nr:sex comb on midleg-like protein 4 isoform X1 [Polyodon spathula]XP_041109258.1 sex comb on midleg-like protein 4 isoform X1 [Polyodon spathula]